MSDEQDPDAPPVVPAMTPEREAWAVALLIEKQHGDCAPAFVAERIGARVLAGGAIGVERLFPLDP